MKKLKLTIKYFLQQKHSEIYDKIKNLKIIAIAIAIVIWPLVIYLCIKCRLAYPMIFFYIFDTPMIIIIFAIIGMALDSFICTFKDWLYSNWKRAATRAEKKLKESK